MDVNQASCLILVDAEVLSIVGVAVIQVNREGSNILLSLSSSETLVKVILVHLFQWTLESSVNINYAAFNSTKCISLTSRVVGHGQTLCILAHFLLSDQ